MPGAGLYDGSGEGVMIAKIAVSAATYAIDKPYSYLVDAGMHLQPGQRVMVPFGRGSRRTEGVVLVVEDGNGAGLKAVERCLDEEPVLDAAMLHLAAFLRDRYFCTYYEAIRAMLPAGLWFRSREICTLVPGAPWREQCSRQNGAMAVLELLERLGGQADTAALREAAEDEDALRGVLRYLSAKKWITIQSDFLRRTGDKTEKIATLAASAEEAMEYAAHRPKSAAMQRAVLEFLCSAGSASVKEICYYTGAKTASVNRLEKLGYLKLSEQPVFRCRQISPAKTDGPLELGEEQRIALEGLAKQMELPKPGAALLYGVTGSGKTAVYLKLIGRCLDSGRSAMLLVPEIALTPQLLNQVSAHFGSQTAVLHSSLPAGERYDQWKRVRTGLARVVVGTRSAVFAPLEKLGLIILDEEQEHSYKSENAPRYCAKEVALWRGMKENALVLFGSATPSVETMYRAKTGVYKIYTLTSRYNGQALPKVKIVDMREEIKAGNDSPFSRELLAEIASVRETGKQAILFLNRRGNSRALVCVNCREAMECPRCSARLTYHSANDRLMCHYCGYSQPVPPRCPHCGGSFKRIGCGTQKLQEELTERFPQLEIVRMDADTVSAANSHEKILDYFQSAHAPVLVGTQMVAKGLNLPDVTLVGVLDADISLYADSFRAAETTFTMLTQVIGRAGRGDAPGCAVIQTMAPEHQVIRLAAEQNYDGFYDLEIGLRRVQQCPPFGDITMVTFTGKDEGRVLRGAAKFRESLLAALKGADGTLRAYTVLGPAPCPVPKINYNFRYRLTLRGSLNRDLRALLGYILRQFMKDGDNRGVSAFVDVNGYE